MIDLVGEETSQLPAKLVTKAIYVGGFHHKM